MNAEMTAGANSPRPEKIKPPKQPRNMIKGFAMPYIVLCVVFVVVPLFIMVYYAFTDKDGGVSFQNFLKFFNDTAVLKSLLRSFLYALATTVICFMIAYPVALILTGPKLKKFSILILLFILPMWINSLLRIYSLKVVLFEFLGMKQSAATVIMGMVYDFFPFMLLPIHTILSGIDKSYMEAAGDLGASPFKSLLRVKLPLSMPGILSGTIMVFMPALSNYAINNLLSNGKVPVFGTIIDNYMLSNDVNTGAAFSLILLVIVVVCLLIGRLFTRKGKIKIRPGVARASIGVGKL